MSTDLLLAYANERVDLVDFEFLADSGFQDNLHQPNAQFFTDPNGQRSWILDGFDITTPGGTKQVQVDKGRAILGRREGALVSYGALTVEGDATKIIDMATLTPSASYGLYIRFEYVDGDTSSRVFWNPASSGSEIAQSVATRRKANWSMRIELTSPGGEWLKIATLDNTGTPVVATPEHPYYFEGEPHNSYQSGWSSDGGGVANDRNADRATYGVKDFQAFTAATRQCLEDIKGRGLRRWWDRDIGGMNLGFDAAPVEDRLQVGSTDTYLDGASGSERLQLNSDTYLDATPNAQKLRLITNTFLDADVDNERLSVYSHFYLWHDGTDTFLYFDANDYLQFTRADDEYSFVVNTAEKMQIDPDGVSATGIAVSSTHFIDPIDDSIRVGNDDFRMAWVNPDPYLYFSSNDYIWEDRSANRMYIAMDSGNVLKADSVGIALTGLAIDSTLTLGAIADTIRVGDTWFRMYWSGTRPWLYWSQTSYMFFDRGNDIFKIFMEGSETFRAYSDPNDCIEIGGDTDFRMEWDGTDPYIYFGTEDDYIFHDISNDVIEVYVDGSNVLQITQDTLHIETVLEVDTAKVDTTVEIGDPNYDLLQQAIRWSTATTAATVDVTKFLAYSTGDMAQGFGGKVDFSFADSGVEYAALEIEWSRYTADDRSLVNFHVQRSSATGAMHTMIHHGSGDIPVFGRYIDPSLSYSRGGNNITTFVTASSGSALTQNDIDYAYLGTFHFIDTTVSGAGISLGTPGTRKGFVACSGNTGRAAFVHGSSDDDIEFHSGGVNGTTYQVGTYDASNSFWFFGDGGVDTSVIPGSGGVTVKVFGGSADTDCALAAYRSTTTSSDHVFQVHSNVASTAQMHFNVEAGGDCRNTGGNYLTISDECTKDFINDFYAVPSPLLPYDLGRVFATIKPIHYGSKLLDHKKAELFGFRGAQVQKVLPSLSTKRGNDDFLSVSLTGMIPVMWEAIRQIMDRLDMLGTPV